MDIHFSTYTYKVQIPCLKIVAQQIYAHLVLLIVLDK